MKEIILQLACKYHIMIIGSNKFSVLVIDEEALKDIETNYNCTRIASGKLEEHMFGQFIIN